MKPETTVSFEDTAVAFQYKSDGAIRKANFIFSMVNHPFMSSLATGAVRLALKLRLPVEGIIRKTAFDHFCGGENIEETSASSATLSRFGVQTILDYSVEGEKSEEGFDRTMDETIRTIEKAHLSKSIPFSVFKVTGIASTEVLEKVQQKIQLTHEEHKAFELVRHRVDNICRKAHAYGIPVLVDAEETWIQDTIDALAYEMMEKYNREKAIVFNTYQLYRTASLDNLKASYEEALKHHYFLGVKLVRGAYMEKERARAADKGYASPIQPDKDATDRAFNEALEFCVGHHGYITTMCGSHNEYSNHYLTTLMHKKGLQPNDVHMWFAQLYGMSDNISFNLAKAGYNVAKYVPYGPVRSVMPYLLRRASENTSVAGQSSRELMLIRKELQRRRNGR